MSIWVKFVLHCFFFRDFKKESKFNLNIFRTNLFQFKLLISILIAYANKYVT